MNHELINKLADRCTIQHVEYFDGRGNVTTDIFDKVMFTKQVVEECIDQILVIYRVLPLEQAVTLLDVVAKIEDHFYVER